jgi:Predicted membrane protein
MVVNLVRRRGALVAVAGSAALALAGCGGSGSGGQDQYALSGSARSSSTTAHSSATGGAHIASRSSADDAPSTHAGGPHTTAAGGGGNTSAAGGGGAGGGGGGGNGGGGGGGGGPASTCATSVGAGAVITVCPATGLHDGQQVRITGHGFDPKYFFGQLLAVQCRYLGESATNYGAGDCNVNQFTFAGAAQTKTTDSQGDMKPVTLTVRQKFKGFDCARQQCIIAVSPPNPNPPATDNPHVLIKFG